MEACVFLRSLFLRELESEAVSLEWEKKKRESVRGESERVPTLFFLFDVGQSAQQVSCFFCRLQMMLRVRQVMWPGGMLVKPCFFCDTGPPNGSGVGGWGLA